MDIEADAEMSDIDAMNQARARSFRREILEYFERENPPFVEAVDRLRVDLQKLEQHVEEIGEVGDPLAQVIVRTICDLKCFIRISDIVNEL